MIPVTSGSPLGYERPLLYPSFGNSCIRHRAVQNYYACDNTVSIMKLMYRILTIHISTF